MKNETTRTKTLSGFSYRAIALVLCFVMLLTAIGSGSVLSAIAADFEGNGASVLLDAAKAGASVDVAADVAAADDKADADEDEAPLTKKADSDLADTGRDADVASTGWNTANSGIAIGTTNSESSLTWHKIRGSEASNAYADFMITTQATYYYMVPSDDKRFAKVAAWSTAAFSDSNAQINTYYANNNNGSYTLLSATFPKGQYVFQMTGRGGTSNDTVEYKLYRKKVYLLSDMTTWSGDGTEMTFHGTDQCYYYQFTAASAGDKYFKIKLKDNGDRYFYPNTNGEQVGSTYDTGYGCGNSSDTAKSFKIPCVAGGTYKIWIKIDGGSTQKVWVEKDEPKEFYLTGYVNGTDYTGTDYKFTGSNDNYTYTLSSTKASQYLTVTDNSGNTYHPGSHPAANGAAYTYTDNKPAGDNKWGITSGASGKNITFTWKPNTKTLSWAISSGGSIDVFAKDGAAPINWENKTSPGATSLSGYNGNYYYNYGIIGRTTIRQIAGSTASGVSTVDCDIVGGTSGSKYDFKNIEVGKTVTIRTTIESPYRSKYYVAGWCVNGITYKKGTDTVGVNAAADTPTGTGVCEFTYTLPSDTEGMLKDKYSGSPVVEITPIYYLRDKSNTVTFYLEGYSDVQKKWGNTPYAYPFYGNLSGHQNTFGAYPGQPMVNVGGQISIEVPIYTNPISVSVASTVIKGVTVNNGYADHVHRNLVYGWTTGTNVNDDKDHMQTYDYDDFYKIWAERIVNGEHPNAIFFRIKEETNKYNRSTYGGGSTSGQFATGTSNISISDIASSGNGWELMKDRHDRNVNIFGDYSAVSSVTASSATADTSKAIYVVSTGYNANIAGDYGTMWKIYDGNGKLITNAGGRVGIPPSLLNLAGNASSGMTSTVSYPSANRSVPGVGSYTDANSNYNAIYKALKASTYDNKLVYITYEKDTQDTRNTATGEGAYRVDGKWFYTHASDDVTSTIGIEYYDKATGTWKADTVSSTSTGLGTTTKAKAVFNSDSYASSSNQTTSKAVTIGTGDTSWNFTADEFASDNSYAFSGWYLKYDDTYEQVTGSTNIGSIKATANYRLIARYVPLASNSLVITHQLDPESTGTGEAKMTVTYGGTSQTVNYVDGVARANVNVTFSNKNIVVKLTPTPKNDGKVTKFTDDAQISPTVSGGSVPGAEGAAVTKTLTFSDHLVYNSAGTSLNVTQLDYTSKIEATPHYYEFTYNFTDRGGAPKKYTARGEISEDHYAEYVNSSHQVSDAFVKSRAPFESNFLQTLKLGTISGKNYDTSTHTLSATATYNATPYTPVYDVKIKLPYNYRTEDATESGVKYKKYNANGSDYNENQAPFTLKANYDEFVTIDATETTAGAQTNVSKVVDVAADPNHTGNDFITAPNTLVSSGTTMYFRYWEIKRLADNDTDQAAAPVISRIYFPDLNYRFYADSYVEAVYTTNSAEYWSNVNKNHTNSELSCSVLYLESSRNQYNTVANGTSTSAANAADIIYNDFIFSYRLGDEEYIPASKAEIGMILERVKNSAGTAWVEGDSSITDMDSYKAANSSTENKTAIITALRSGGTLPNNCLKQTWDNSKLNNRNYTEQPYPVYAQYGQTVADHSITFTTDGTMDNYVYRAWAYIKDSDGNVAVSDPAYFSMNYIASQNYSE